MRVEQITFTRFLAAIAIVIYHYALKLYPFNTEIISTIFKHATVGVSYFFILSGFVMIIAYGQKAEINTADYFKNRVARIYPVYLLAIILLFIHFVLSRQDIDYMGLFLNVFVIQAWVPAKAIEFNSPGWSLTVEFFFYAIFPFLLQYIYKARNYRKVIVPVIIFWILSQVLFNLLAASSFNQGFPSASYNLLYYFPIMHLNEFLIGNVAGLYFIGLHSSASKNYDGYIIFIAVLILVFMKFSFGLNYHNGLLAILFVPFILLLSMNNGRITRLFNHKWLVFLGEISYGIYILQYPVFTWTRSLLKSLDITGRSQIFYISFIVLIIVSGISYHFIETPLRNRIKKIRFKKD